MPGMNTALPALTGDLAAVEAHHAGAGEDVVGFRRRMAVQAQPVAGTELGDAASDAGRPASALGKQGPPMDPAAHRIVPAV